MDDELRALRARAYGPGADIADDASAVRRLQDLESAPPRQPAYALEPPKPDVAEAPPSKMPFPGESDPSPIVTPSARSRWRFPALWAGSIVVSILGTAYASLMLNEPISLDPQSAGAQQVARLQEDSEIEVPELFDQAGPEVPRAVREYNGLQVTVGPEAFGAGQDDEVCLTVLKRSELDSVTPNSFSGAAYSGCAANDFPATVVIVVTSDMPRQLRDQFPDGTALQFVYDGARSDVVVFSSPE